MPSGVVSVGVLADFAELIEQSDQAGLSIEAFSGKVVTSSRTASRAMVDLMKTNGASADEMEDAAARVAAAWDATYGQLSRGAKDQANAALMAARAAGESADQQSAAYAKAAAAARDAELQQKTSADAIAKAQETAAAAAKASADVQARAAKLAADAQADAAAKADLLNSRLGSLGERSVGVAAEISKLGSIALVGSIAGMGDLAAKYQEATESIAANSGISSKAAANIGKAFLGTSGTSIYSAKEMTEAFALVAGQLKSTEGQALGTAGAMKFMATASNLGEATGESLASATSALSMVMQGYKLSVGQAASAGDLLFNTSRALDQPMNTVAQAVNRLHGRLGTLAPSLGDVGGLMVEIGSHGVQGTRGVSVMNTAFQKLIGNSQPVDEMLDDLGVHIFNAQGKFVGMQQVIAQLQPKFAQLSQQSQDLAAKTLFGSSASQVMLSVINRGPQAFASYVAAAQKSGTAAKGAADQTKTFAKQFDILKASIENDATSIGMKLMPELTTMTHGLEDGVGWLAKNKTAVDALGIAIGTVLAGAVSVFAYQKATAFVSGVQDMAGGVAKLSGKLLGGDGLEAAAKATAPEVALVGTDAELATAKVEAFGGAAAEATPEVAGLDTAAKGLVGSLGTLGTLSVGFGAFEALKQTPGIGNVVGNGPQGTKALGGFPMPTTGETERAYVQKAAGLPGYKGPLTAAAVMHARTQSGYPTGENSEYEQLFKRLGSVGHFGQHGFVAKPVTAGGTASTSTSGAGWAQKVSASESAGGSSSVIQWAADAQAAAKKYGVNPALLLADISQESGGTPVHSTGSTPGVGNLTQFLPSTGAEYGVKFGTTPADELSQIMGQAKYLSGLGAKKNAFSALEGYNSGTPGNPVSAGYANSVLSMVKEYSPLFAGKLGTIPITGATAPAGVPAGASGGGLNAAVQNIGSGGQLPAAIEATSYSNQATQLQDQATRAQAVGQAQVTVLQAINQQLQDKGAAIVQKLSDRQAKADDQSAKIVTALKDSTQTASDKATAQVTALKDQQTINDEHSAILVAKIQDQTTAINDASAITVAAINASAARIADADNAQATLITDNAQTNADTINERGLYGLNLVAQQLQVVADQVKTGFDTQIATAQATLDSDQGLANIANAAQQYNVDQVTATQDMKVLQAQQNLNTVTLKEDALEAKAQAHLDAVTAKQDALEAAAKIHVDSVTMTQDAKANAAKAHLDSVTISQDNRILKATQHADAVQLSVDTTKIGPAQTVEDWAATQNKATQTMAQNALNLATAQGNQTVNAAQLQLQNVTAGANDLIADAQNSYQKVQNAANTAIQTATNQYQAAQDKANQAIQTATSQYTGAQDKANAAIQNATDNYQTVQDKANKAIANATQTAAQTASNWATQLAKDQLALTGIQGKAAIGEASTQGAVTTEQALESTQFAGSGLVVNQYGVDLSNPAAVSDAASWAIRASGIATA